MTSTKAQVKTVKAQVLKMLQAGLASDFIAKTCNVSPTQVREWEEEYLRDILSSGAGQRIRIRNLLLRNTPQMVNALYKMAMQEVDPKMQMTAASTFLNFASRFFKEDAGIAAAEAKATEVAGGNVAQTLFDFVIPGEMPVERREPQGGELFGETEEEEGEGWEIEPEELDSYSGNSFMSTSEDTSS